MRTLAEIIFSQFSNLVTGHKSLAVFFRASGLNFFYSWQVGRPFRSTSEGPGQESPGSVLQGPKKMIRRSHIGQKWKSHGRAVTRIPVADNLKIYKVIWNLTASNLWFGPVEPPSDWANVRKDNDNGLTYWSPNWMDCYQSCDQKERNATIHARKLDATMSNPAFSL